MVRDGAPDHGLAIAPTPGVRRRSRTMPTRNTSARRKATHATRTTPRHMWLAALGLVAVARREAPTAIGSAAAQADRLRQSAFGLARDARDITRGVAITLQEAVSARIASRRSVRKPARKPRKTPGGSAGRRSAAGRRQASVRIARKGRG
jgi:hypothetical protein